MNFIANLIVTFFGILFEQIDIHNGKGLPLDPYMVQLSKSIEEIGKRGKR